MLSIETLLLNTCLAVAIYQLIAFLKKRNSKHVEGVSANCQSLLLPGAEKVHSSSFKNVDPDPSVKTAYDVFSRGEKISKNSECLGYRPGVGKPYKWMTYANVFNEAHKFGSWIRKTFNMSNVPVGLYSKNRPEWTISAIALCSQSIPIIPLYDTFGKESILEILKNTQISLIICDNVSKLNLLLEAKLHGIESLKSVILFDYEEEKVKRLSDELDRAKITVYDYGTSKDLQNPTLKMPKPSDIFTICHTSGSTGVPRGAIITHENYVNSIKNTVNTLEQQNMFDSKFQRIISFLPMAHIYEQINQGIAMYYGVKIGFYSGNINHLMDDIKELKPHLLPTVPRLLNRLHDEVVKKVEENFCASLVFWSAIYVKLLQAKIGFGWQNYILDMVIFGKVRSQLGGSVCLCASGSAPINASVLNTCRAMLGCYIIEGYGQTESTGAITATLISDKTSGHVGALMTNTLAKLVDVPECEYYSSNDQGEICIKGPTVSPGYFKNGTIVRDHLDEGGWLHTGDIGQWLPNGALKIIDRRKHIFKLSQGEYIAPEKIESVCLRSTWVSQIFVDGNSEMSYLVAIVVPEKQALLDWSRQQGVAEEKIDYLALCKDEHLIKTILDNLTTLCKGEGLNSLEVVKRIHLTMTPFSIDNGLLTPTMKNRRSNMRKYYSNVIQSLYEKQ